jgi:hypothetical protein
MVIHLRELKVIILADNVFVPGFLRPQAVKTHEYIAPAERIHPPDVESPSTT